MQRTVSVIQYDAVMRDCATVPELEFSPPAVLARLFAQRVAYAKALPIETTRSARIDGRSGTQPDGGRGLPP